MRLAKLFEGLDDRDEFEQNCHVCRIHGRNLDDSRFDADGFHTSHIAAHTAAGIIPGNHYETEMYKRGWKRFKGTWYRKDDPRIVESLDDKDEFGGPCSMCYVQNFSVGDDELETEFHIAHTDASAIAGIRGHISTVDAFEHDKFLKEMSKAGWRPGFGYGWVKMKY